MADYGYIWLQAKVPVCRLGLRPRTNADPVYDSDTNKNHTNSE